MTTVGPFIAAFIFGAIADALWSLYIRAVGEQRAVRAGIASASIAGLGMAAVLVLIYNPWTCLADIAGSFCGTYLIVRSRPNVNVSSPSSEGSEPHGL